MHIHSEREMMTVGKRIASACLPNTRIYLQGPLGTGKTTLARGIIAGMGYQHRVKSPSFTIVEPYEINGKKIYHCDLYRIHDPAELIYLGLDDYFEDADLILVEWPEHGHECLPEPDIKCLLEYEQSNRRLQLVSCTPLGDSVISGLKRH